MTAELTTYELYSPRSRLGPYRAADYCKLPDEPACELLYGRFFVSPSPTALHQIVAYLLWEMLMNAARRSGGIALGAPIDVALAEHSVVQPDVLYVSAERRKIVKSSVEGPPDLVAEVVSAKTARRDRGEKLQLYAASDIREYWVVDPEGQQIDFLINRQGRFEVALAQNDLYRSEILPEIELDLARFWSEVKARLSQG